MSYKNSVIVVFSSIIIVGMFSLMTYFLITGEIPFFTFDEKNPLS